MSEQKFVRDPVRFQDELRAGNVSLFLGDGINHGTGGVVGMPTYAESIATLAARCGYPAGVPRSLPLIAQFCLERFSRDSLVGVFKDIFHQPDFAPGANHRAIARLPVRWVVTTCYDDLIERALDQTSPRRSYVRLVGRLNIAFFSSAKLPVMRLWGDLSRPKSLVLTDEDWRDSFSGRWSLTHYVAGDIPMRSWVFLGCDFEHPWLRDLLNRTRMWEKGRVRQAYAVGTAVSTQVRNWLSKRWISVIDMGVAEGLAALEQAVQGGQERQAATEREQVQAEPEGTEWQADDDSRRAERDGHVAQQGGRGRAELDGSAMQAAPPDQWDVFISHAWEDKETIARPLAMALEAQGLRVWFDEFTLTVGDRLRRSVDKGLANCRYGIVILSPMFFAKEWPQKELDGLVQRENKGEKVILPVWHNMSAEQIAVYSPPLADRIAVLSSRGLDQVVAELLRAMGREL